MPRDRYSPGSLPPANTRRWVPRRKAQVLAGIADGLLTITEACERYSLTLEELAGWHRLFERGGVKGLRATKMQEYRGFAEASIEH